MTIFGVPLQYQFAGTSRSQRRTAFIPLRTSVGGRPVINQTVEYKSNAQSAIISGFQLSAILGQASPANAAAPPNSHRRPVYRFPAGSFFGGFPTPAPYTGSIARAGPASETLHDLSRWCGVEGGR